MAHNFLGTFNRSQWERFLGFARSQLPLAAGRIQQFGPAGEVMKEMQRQAQASIARAA